MKACKSCLKNFNEPYEVIPCYMDDKGILFFECIECSSIMSDPIILNLEVDTMAKTKPVAEAPKQTVWESKTAVCQCCRLHDNKPSTCSWTGKPVGRKQDATDCKKYKRTK